MFQRKNFFPAIFSIIALVSCNDNTSKTQEAKDESKSVAEEKNEKKFNTDSAEKTAQFLVDIAGSNIHEIEMAKAAKSKGMQSIGDMLVTDHSKVLSDIQGLASARSVSLPTAETEDQRKETEKFKGEKGKDFEEDWTEKMIEAHKKGISKFEDVANSGMDNEIKTWASSLLPTLRHHLDMLQQFKDKIKK